MGTNFQVTFVGKTEFKIVSPIISLNIVTVVADRN